jgi:hypothetical protein
MARVSRCWGGTQLDSVSVVCAVAGAATTRLVTANAAIADAMSRFETMGTLLE